MIRRVGWVVVSLWLGVGNLLERRHGRKTRSYNAGHHGAVTTITRVSPEVMRRLMSDDQPEPSDALLRLAAETRHPQDATPAEWEARRPQDAP